MIRFITELYSQKTLLEDFKDEIEHVGLIEELETEEKWEQDSRIQGVKFF